jgi:hypothetical protein
VQAGQSKNIQPSNINAQAIPANNALGGNEDKKKQVGGNGNAGDIYGSESEFFNKNK